MPIANRRSFLKASTLAAAAVVPGLPAASPAFAAPNGVPSASVRKGKAMGSTPADLANLLQGAASTPQFSHGNTLPIATTPFGMAHWTIQNVAGSPWMFQPWARRTQGFRCTHQLSPWLFDYGDATFLPTRGTVNPDAGARASSYDVEGAKLRPYSLELFLLRFRITAELIPTERCCLLTAGLEAPNPESHAIPSSGPAEDEVPGLIIDVPSVAGEIKQSADKKQIMFASDHTSGGTPEGFACYYVVQFTEAPAFFNVEQPKMSPGMQGRRTAGNHRVATIRFTQGSSMEARIGTSFISYEQAAYNLQQELASKSADTLRAATKEKWNGYLNRIEIEGATEVQEETFYSCMYRTLLFPRTFHEPKPGAAGEDQEAFHHYSCFNGKVEPGYMYADHGYWDVYRAWYPLATILFPEKLDEILLAWINVYKEGGWFPQFPAPGYRACMSGSLIDSLFADAIVKGIGSFDKDLVLQGLKKHATGPGDPDKGYGRVGVEEYMKLHYIPADKIEQTVAETADAAYGDFCLAQIAKVIGKQDDYKYFIDRSEYWKNIYDREIGFFRGKNSDGSWVTPFNSFQWGSPYEEGSAWQHRWDAPHAIHPGPGGLIEAIGGPEKAAAALDAMLSTPAIFHTGVYGSEIHEMSEIAAVPFGQYAHSNQPSHHLLYIYPHTGHPAPLQKWARKVMDELYSPESFAGDEDTGSMAAWYVLSSLGFYQVCPAVPEYTFGSPLWKRAVVHLPGDKTLTVEAPTNTPENVYVHGVKWNGQAVAGPVVSHKDLVAGGTLTFQMAAAPKA